MIESKSCPGMGQLLEFLYHRFFVVDLIFFHFSYKINH
jgi:hypothetical protein